MRTAANRLSKAWSREEVAAKLGDKSEKHTVLSWHQWIALQLPHSPASSSHLLHTEALQGTLQWTCPITLPVQSSAAAAFLLPCTQRSKHLIHIWWSSEQIWWSSHGRKRWWSDISQMGCQPAPGLLTSLMSASHLVILSLLMICTTLGSLSCLIRACILL